MTVPREWGHSSQSHNAQSRTHTRPATPKRAPRGAVHVIVSTGIPSTSDDRIPAPHQEAKIAPSAPTHRGRLLQSGHQNTKGRLGSIHSPGSRCRPHSRRPHSTHPTYRWGWFPSLLHNTSETTSWEARRDELTKAPHLATEIQTTKVAPRGPIGRGVHQRPHTDRHTHMAVILRAS